MVDADAVLALPSAFEFLEAIARQSRQVGEICRCLQAIQFQTRGPLEARESLYALASREAAGSLVATADDHDKSIAVVMRYVKRNYGWAGGFPRHAFRPNRTPQGRQRSKAGATWDRIAGWSVERMRE